MNIWTNGCFDVLHTGHIDLLWYAKLFKKTENTLIVGVDGDERVRQLKGEGRPINSIWDRTKMLLNLRMVDRVVVFNSDDELKQFIRSFRIDYMIIGDDHKEVIGKECSKYGVVFYPTDHRSSTRIINAYS